MAYRRSGPLAAYRIADRRHPIFDGTGAFLRGSRWNSVGRRVIYAAETYAGALLEILVHANLARVPRSHAWIKIEVPAGVEIEEVRSGDVPGWDHAGLSASRAYGDSWHDERRTAVLLVPSVVTRGMERNVLINQDHREFSRLIATPPRKLVWDPRFFR